MILCDLWSAAIERATASLSTRQEFDNCIAPIFENLNLANAATQAGNGNYLEVAFSVTYSPYAGE